MKDVHFRYACSFDILALKYILVERPRFIAGKHWVSGPARADCPCRRFRNMSVSNIRIDNPGCVSPFCLPVHVINISGQSMFHEMGWVGWR